MTDRFLKFTRIAVLILFILAIAMGAWLLFSKFMNKDDDGKTQENITLEWWVLWENESDIRVIADAYEADHPNVKITVTNNLISNYKDKAIKQLSDGASDTGPDMLRIHSTWVPAFEDSLEPLPETVMSPTDYANTFYSTAVVDLTGTDGNIYAIPMMFDALGLYFNKDLLQRGGYTYPETTWDAFVKQAQNVTWTDPEDESKIMIAGAGIGTSNNVDFSFEILSLLMLQEEATIVDNSGKTTFATDSDQKVAKAVKFYTDFSTRYKVWDSTLAQDIQMFTEGRLSMMFAPSWRVFDIENALATKGAELNYDIAPVPQQPTLTGDTVYYSDYWAEAVSSECQYPEVAWDFLKFATESDQLQNFYEKTTEADYRNFGEIYSRQDMYDLLIGERYVDAYLKMADTSRSWKMVNKEEVSAEFNALITEITATGTISDVGSIQTELQTMAPEIDAIILNSLK